MQIACVCVLPIPHFENCSKETKKTEKSGLRSKNIKSASPKQTLNNKAKQTEDSHRVKNLQPLLQSYEVALTQSPHAFATYKKTGYSCYILSQKAEREVSSAYKRVVKTKSSLQRLIPSISDKAEEVSARNRTAQITSRAILPADLFDPPLCSGFQAARGPNGITWVSKIGFPSRGTISAKYSLLQTKFSRLLA